MWDVALRAPINEPLQGHSDASIQLHFLPTAIASSRALMMDSSNLGRRVRCPNQRASARTF